MAGSEKLCPAMTENWQFCGQNVGSFGGWILFLLETFFFSVGNQKMLCYNFNTATHGGLKNIIFENFLTGCLSHLPWMSPKSTTHYVRHSPDCTCCDFGHLRFLCFSGYYIIPLFYSQTISLWTEKKIRLRGQQIFKIFKNHFLTSKSYFWNHNKFFLCIF
jgi:hypothetical protein